MLWVAGFAHTWCRKTMWLTSLQSSSNLERISQGRTKDCKADILFWWQPAKCHRPHCTKERPIAMHSSRKIKFRFSQFTSFFGSYANLNALKVEDADRLIAPSPPVQLHWAEAERSESSKGAYKVRLLQEAGANRIPGASSQSHGLEVQGLHSSLSKSLKQKLALLYFFLYAS